MTGALLLSVLEDLFVMQSENFCRMRPRQRLGIDMGPLRCVAMGHNCRTSSYNRTVTGAYNLPPIDKISSCQACGLYVLPSALPLFAC